MPDIFVSYSRRDSEFVRRLVNALQDRGREIWVDFDDIPFGSNWWEEILEGISASTAGIFVISPDSIASQVCSMEIAQLIQNRKRLIPIVLRRVDDKRDQLPEAIRSLNWLFFDDDTKFDESVENLIKTLDTDLGFAKDHTRLLLRSNEWKQKGHNPSFLLRGDELSAFVNMVDRPDLTADQREYLTESIYRESMYRQIRRFAFGFVGGAVGMGFYIFSVFRGGFSPQQVTLTIAAGEVFGLFVGIIALFADDFPVQMEQFVPKSLHRLIQMIVCLMMGILSWMIYQWFFLQLPLAASPIVVLGGIGVASGFMIHSLFRPAPWITLVLTTLGIFLPIYFLSSQSPSYSAISDNPLIYFDRPEHIYTIGLPMAFLMAFGANAQILWQRLRRRVKRVGWWVRDIARQMR